MNKNRALTTVNKKTEFIEHTFEPVYDKNATILILGTMPSVKSRRDGFYYANPRNAFWEIIAGICGVSVPKTVDEKKKMLVKNHIAIWDVCKSCDIYKSDDSSISKVVPNDIKSLLNDTKIRNIYFNGQKAKQIYDKFFKNDFEDIKTFTLPSTSPANAGMNFEEKEKQWKKLVKLG